MDKKKMIEDYERAVNAIAVAFLNKQYGDPEEPPIAEVGGDYYWAGDEVGDILCVGDVSFSFDDVLTDIKEDASVGEIDRYYDYCLRCSYLGLEPKINYHAWLHGAPHTPDETLDHLEKMKADFAAEIERAKNEKES